MLDFPDLLERMRKVSHFKGCSTDNLGAILRSGRIKKYHAGATLFYEKDPCFGLCVLLQGEVHLYKLGPQGQENIIGVIKPVIMFNEVAAIDSGPNPITAKIHKESLIWVTSAEDFRYILKQFPQLAIGLLSILAKRNRMLAEKYADLSFRPVRERVATLLLEMSEHGKAVIQRKEHTIQQLAAYIASVPVVVSRTLGEFREEGMIESDRAIIRVTDPDALAKIAWLNDEEMFKV